MASVVLPRGEVGDDWLGESGVGDVTVDVGPAGGAVIVVVVVAVGSAEGLYETPFDG